MILVCYRFVVKMGCSREQRKPAVKPFYLIIQSPYVTELFLGDVTGKYENFIINTAFNPMLAALRR